MFIVNSYALAVIFCFVTMLCWGSWGNTQKLAAKTWRYELFYWDYVIGMFLFALILSLTMGSFGAQGRPFLQDLGQASWSNIGSALLGGVIFNASNILLSASTALAGMAVAFPLGVGLAVQLVGLQLLDGAADTGLGEKQVLGGLVDRAAAGDLYHIEKLLKRHGRHLHNTVFCIPLL